MNLIGKYIDDRFRVQERLGSGGMGVVYIAEDLARDQKVALKVMRKEVADPAAKERFLREVQSLAKINSPHIVRVFAFGRDMQSGIIYAAMELAQGDDLSVLIEAGRFKVPLAMKVVEDITRALTHIHPIGIYHRDLKPANIKVVPQAPHVICKLLDFGLVLTDDGVNLTGQGQAPGTVSYMSPEELREEPLDQRIDVYKLGVICFEMLTGKKPFLGKAPLDTAHKILTDPVPTIGDYVDDVPIYLSLFTQKLMAKDRDHRYRDASEVLEALNRIERTLHPEFLECKHEGASKNPFKDYDLLVHIQ